MILAARKHLLATNIIFFFIIYVVQKFIQVFCIIEEKACKNSQCNIKNRCEDRCITTNDATPAIVEASPPTPPQSPTPPVKGLRLIPMAMRKTMRSFGYGEGHYQIFVEEKQRQKPARLNAAVAEVKLNPN